MLLTAHSFGGPDSDVCVRVCRRGSGDVCVCVCVCVSESVCSQAARGEERRGVCCRCIGSAIAVSLLRVAHTWSMFGRCVQGHTNIRGGGGSLVRGCEYFKLSVEGEKKKASFWDVCAWLRACVLGFFTGDSPCAKPTLSTCSGTNTASVMNPDVGVAGVNVDRSGLDLSGDIAGKKKSPHVRNKPDWHQWESLQSRVTARSVRQLHIIYVLCSPFSVRLLLPDDPF